MITKTAIIDVAHEYGFEDIGFTTAQPFDDHKAYLDAHQDEYRWADATGLKLLDGTDPKNILPEAKTIIVLTWYIHCYRGLAVLRFISI